MKGTPSLVDGSKRVYEPSLVDGSKRVFFELRAPVYVYAPVHGSHGSHGVGDVTNVLTDVCVSAGQNGQSASSVVGGCIAHLIGADAVRASAPRLVGSSAHSVFVSAQRVHCAHAHLARP